MNDKLEEYKQVQSIAKKVLNAIPQYISSESTEFDIAEKCKELLENRLHTHFKNFVKIGMTYSQIYTEMNNQIKSLGYENLDFGGNVGHSIEINKDDRLYFEKNNIKNLTSDKLFTFEPHIKKTGSKWGFKLENIYYFDENGCVIEL